MSIPFTQYLRPDGRKRSVEIEMSQEIEAMAQKFISSGGWFEVEELYTGHASLTACKEVEAGEPDDIAVEVVPNGPEVPAAVERLVHKAMAWLQWENHHGI